MTPQEKQQIKARFFGMHIGCKVQIDGNLVRVNAGCVFRKPNSESKVPPMPFLNFYQPEQFGAVAMCAVDRCKLILRPLSGLTDEELEIVRQLTFSHVPSVAQSFAFERFKQAWVEMCRPSPDNFSVRVADYLRSIGICLPFHGFDPVAEGWAILETNR